MKQRPVMPAMCGTCPFRPESPFASLAPELAVSACTEGLRICHSTGSNAIHSNTGVPEHACFGAREVQLKFWHSNGYIAAPTEEAWQAKCDQLGIVNGVKERSRRAQE